jgi:hypothetical protein
LLLGRLKPKELELVFGQKQVQSHIFGAIVQQLRASDETAQYLAVNLLQRNFVASHSGDGERSEETARALLSLLEGRDAVSKAVVGLVAEYAAQYPIIILTK